MAGNPTGNAITNQIAYIANMIGKGQMPYGGSPVGNYLQQLANPFQGGAIQRRPVVNPEFTRPDYSGASERERRFQEYRTGRDIPGANTDYSARLGGGSSGASQGGGGGRYQGAGSFTPLDPYAAQNREYERERARVEAMVKANPDMQKQAIADERAKVRDQGMALWAKANPTLAKQVKPGAVGYDVIQRGLNVGAMGTPMDLPFDTSNVLGGTPMPEGLSYGTTTPTAIPGGTPIKGGGFPEGQAAMFQRFMQGPATTVPAFQGSPLGTTPQLNAVNYGGAVQPLGTAISDDFYKTEKAKELAAMFANYRLGQ